MLIPLLSAEKQSDLRGTIGEDKAFILSFGISTFMDTVPRLFCYDAASTATDNNSTIFKPNELSTSEPGRWIYKYDIPTSNTVSNPSINTSPARSLNSNFTPSTTRIVMGVYSISCSVTNPLLAGNSTLTAYLEYSTNGGSTWNTLTQNGNSSSVGVAVAIQITNGQTATLSGVIPANALARIRTTTSGTASATLVAQHELTL